MGILYHGKGGWSSLNREKCGNGLNQEGDHANEAHHNKEPKEGHEVDLIFLHVYMIPQGEGDCKGKHGET